MLSHGPVRVDANAKPGKASVLVEFPPTSKLRSFPTELECVIE